MATLTKIVIVASEAVTERTWWDPYLKGAFIVFFAIALFCGSIYLLLYTNVGSRLGFLLAATGVSAIITLLAANWITGVFPNGPLGPAPRWHVVEIVTDPSESSVDAVRRIREIGGPASEEDAGQVETDLTSTLTDPESPFNLFDSADDLLIQKEETLSVGGGRKGIIWFSQHTKHAAAFVCTVDKQAQEVPFGEPPPPRTCDESKPVQWAVAVRDLGARRLPSVLIFLGSALLLALSLIGLHLYDREQRAAEEAPPGGDEGDGGQGGDGEVGGDGQARREPEPAGV